MKVHTRFEATDKMSQPKPAPSKQAKATRTMVDIVGAPSASLRCKKTNCRPSVRSVGRHIGAGRFVQMRFFVMASTPPPALRTV